jgi:class 3 adenylate cyclase
MDDFDLDVLLADLDEDVKTELASMPEVVDKGDDLDVSTLPIQARRWHKVTDAVAVVADLKSSTQLGVSKYPASTASIYEAATGGVVQVFDDLEADFVAIQGDGAFALFWGQNRKARAICAGITIKTFSERHLTPRLEKKWPESLPETGLKVGIANSPLLVKRVGVPRTDYQEQVWAGKAVNYAAKSAQQADRHEMIVTGSIWDWASANDYLAVSCECATPSPSIWSDVTIEKLPDSEPDREGKLLTAAWCTIHGADYCANVLAGNSTREDVKDERTNALKAEYAKAMRLSKKKARENRNARRRGLARL